MEALGAAVPSEAAYLLLIFAVVILYSVVIARWCWLDRHGRYVIVLLPNHSLKGSATLHRFPFDPTRTVDALRDDAEARFQQHPLVLMNADTLVPLDETQTLLDAGLRDGSVVASGYDTQKH